MKVKINFKASVRKDLKGINKAAVIRILDSIENDLALHPGKDKALKGQFEGLYSYRVSDWRVMYGIINGTILVLRIAHRKDSYRNPA